MLWCGEKGAPSPGIVGLLASNSQPVTSHSICIIDVNVDWFRM